MARSFYGNLIKKLRKNKAAAGFSATASICGTSPATDTKY
ncbi:hypothetical protein CLOBOL_00606 [Enterocloster bolteae ATCC BAA-613]|uniref:Uncharacterized protein n=1 Tax=Enterocloster bolteae (strain ATCC BAA-613 / DSM 15670 / CCUG 46953 / JCM 12243 / WAL 16351) TaxID=411902 RepID=A8RI62_ENTBW|nr:hypothetical protein CLOBOL_00606 [Enterocloster bolteae ATCC BAA-613]